MLHTMKCKRGGWRAAACVQGERGPCGGAGRKLGAGGGGADGGMGCGDGGMDVGSGMGSEGGGQRVAWGGAERCLSGDRVQQMENTDICKNSNCWVKNSSW